MHGAHIPSSTIADTMVLIAICTGSRALLELAIALRALTTGSICVPPGPENAEMVHRIARSLLDPQWMTRTRAALGDTRVEQLAGHFYEACLMSVPTNAQAPLSDATWLTGVRSLYSTERAMQFMAEALVRQFAPLRDAEPTEQVPEPPPAVAAVSAPATTSTSSAPSPAEIQAKLIVRLQKIAKLYRFLKLWKAHQARMAAAHSSKPNPAPVAI